MNGASTICMAVRRDASAFLDGRMSARERGRAQRHLRECAACMRELQQLARLSRAMHNLPPHRVADGMAQRLRKQHDGSRATPAERAVTQWAAPRGLAVTRRIALAATLAAALPLVFWLGYRSGCATTPTSPAAPTQRIDDAQPLIAERAPAPPPPSAPQPSALQPRVRPTNTSPEVVAAPVAPPTPLQPAPTSRTADARLAGDRSEPLAPAPTTPTPAPARPPMLDDMHRMMERMMDELLEQVRRR